MTTGAGVDLYEPVVRESNPHDVRKMSATYRHPSPSCGSSDDYGGYPSSSSHRQLSTLESSNNDNNQRISSMSASSHRRFLGDSLGATTGSTASSSHRVPTMTSFQRKDSKVLSNSLASGSNHSRTSSTTAGGLAKRGSSSNNSEGMAVAAAKAVASASNDGADIVIEEKRKRSNGEGYTYHRYLRGRMLGKGGFAKVYLCTSMDTGKHYAVKVVPKSNLVKARARQKVGSKRLFRTNDSFFESCSH